MTKTTHIKPRHLLPAGILLCASFTTARADTITQTVGNLDWNAAMWGTPAAVPITGNDYVSAVVGSEIRFRLSANGAASTFGGSSITVVSGSRALMKNQNGTTSTLNGDFTLDGGRLSHAPNTPGTHAGTLDVANFIVSGTGSFIDINGSTIFTIDGTLTGSGDLLLKPELGSTPAGTVSFTGISGYSGAITVQTPVTLDFGSGYTFTNSLTLQTTAKLNVDQTLTFEQGDLVANGVTIPQGVYTGSGITALGANFIDGGGTLTVVATDTDSDGLPDNYEDLIIQFDTFDDVDGFEDVAGPNNAPTTTDFDGDGRSDAAEFASGVAANQSSPTDPDSDDDGLNDGPEVAGTNNSGVSTGFGPSNPNQKDSDSDRYDDFTEVRYGSNASSNASLPGSAVTVANGGFEEPVVGAAGTAVPVSGGTVTGWSTVRNDFYVVSGFDFAADANPTTASAGSQFATAERRATNPDTDPSAFPEGMNALMSMKQDIDVSSLAAEIDAGGRTLRLDFDVWDSDSTDQAVVTLQFLDGVGADLGRRSVYRATNGTGWRKVQHAGYPPVGTRTVRVTLGAIKVATDTSTSRNIAYDNLTARLANFDLDADGMADDWEYTHGLDPDSAADALANFDSDDLNNLQEFQHGTDPYAVDTDGDGFDDDVEVAVGTDPQDAASAPAPLSVTNLIPTKDGSGQITKIEVVVSGLIPGKTYKLVRGTDLTSFPTIIDTHAAVGTSGSFIDLSPPPSATSSKAFYRVEE